MQAVDLIGVEAGVDRRSSVKLRTRSAAPTTSHSVAAICATTRMSRSARRATLPVLPRDRSATDADEPPRDASSAGQTPAQTAIAPSAPP